MTDYKFNELSTSQPGFYNQVSKIENDKKRKTQQYIAEGVTFFILIALGAVAVFRAVRRQFKQSQQQQNFMMAITHELKTPIAITRLNLETLQKHKLSEEQQQHLISNTLQEAGRLNSLCNNLLLASQIEAGDYNVTNENINIGDIVTESVNDFKMRFPKRNIHSYITEAFITGDRLLLQMAINNLLDNAIKYSGKEGHIEVILEKENEEPVKLLVKDEGKGVPAEEKNKIFNKFYRVGNLPTKEAKGTGLGLYLTKKIIEQHNGSINATDNIPQGTIFEIKLYKS